MVELAEVGKVFRTLRENPAKYNYQSFEKQREEGNPTEYKEERTIFER